ncbi:hypothetical protein Tco_1037731 [Tanacetum coccineum]
MAFQFLRLIDTRPNGDALRKCILKGPYTPTIVTTLDVPAIENSPAVPEQTTVEMKRISRKGQKSKLKQQNRARERKDREKSKRTSQSQILDEGHWRV